MRKCPASVMRHRELCDVIAALKNEAESERARWRRMLVSDALYSASSSSHSSLSRLLFTSLARKMLLRRNKEMFQTALRNADSTVVEKWTGGQMSHTNIERVEDYSFGLFRDLHLVHHEMARL